MSEFTAMEMKEFRWFAARLLDEFRSVVDAETARWLQRAESNGAELVAKLGDEPDKIEVLLLSGPMPADNAGSFPAIIARFRMPEFNDFCGVRQS